MTLRLRFLDFDGGGLVLYHESLMPGTPPNPLQETEPEEAGYGGCQENKGVDEETARPVVKRNRNGETASDHNRSHNGVDEPGEGDKPKEEQQHERSYGVPLDCVPRLGKEENDQTIG